MGIFLQLYKSLKKHLHPANSSVMFVIFFALVLNATFGLLFFIVERDVQPDLTIIDSLWWAMVTMTTVGYGDFYAKTLIGRFLISYPTMLLGIGIIGYLVGIVADFILEFSSKKRRGLMEFLEKNHVIICNYPGVEKVVNLIRELKETEDYRQAPIVLITEKIDELPEELKKFKLFFVKGSPTDEEILLKANIFDSSGVIVLAEEINSASSDERNYTVGSLIELMERESNKPIKTIVEVVKRGNVKLMDRANVDGLVSTDGIAGAMLAQEFINPGINEVINQLLTNEKGSQLYLYPTTLEGHSMYDLQLEVIKNEANIQIIGIIQNGNQILNPPKNLKINKGDKLVLLSENRKEIEKIEEIINKR